jgi:hypothetical protein
MIEAIPPLKTRKVGFVTFVAGGFNHRRRKTMGYNLALQKLYLCLSVYICGQVLKMLGFATKRYTSCWHWMYLHTSRDTRGVRQMLAGTSSPPSSSLEPAGSLFHPSHPGEMVFPL